MDYLALLSEAEKEELLKLPAYISLLAANHNGHIDKQEKQAAIKLSHIKTYSCNPKLAAFYWQADKVFTATMEDLDNQLPTDREGREQAIKKAIKQTEPIIAKLGNEYATSMHHSLESFKNHVARAHDNVLEYLIFPMAMKGIVD